MKQESMTMEPLLSLLALLCAGTAGHAQLIEASPEALLAPAPFAAAGSLPAPAV